MQDMPAQKFKYRDYCTWMHCPFDAVLTGTPVICRHGIVLDVSEHEVKKVPRHRKKGASTRNLEYFVSGKDDVEEGKDTRAVDPFSTAWRLSKRITGLRQLQQEVWLVVSQISISWEFHPGVRPNIQPNPGVETYVKTSTMSLPLLVGLFTDVLTVNTRIIVSTTRTTRIATMTTTQTTKDDNNQRGRTIMSSEMTMMTDNGTTTIPTNGKQQNDEAKKTTINPVQYNKCDDDNDSNNLNDDSETNQGWWQWRMDANNTKNKSNNTSEQEDHNQPRTSKIARNDRVDGGLEWRRWWLPQMTVFDRIPSSNMMSSNHWLYSTQGPAGCTPTIIIIGITIRTIVFFFRPGAIITVVIPQIPNKNWQERLTIGKMQTKLGQVLNTHWWWIWKHDHHCQTTIAFSIRTSALRILRLTLDQHLLLVYVYHTCKCQRPLIFFVYLM